MSESASDKPARRVRYRGTHPRTFQEKYKELQSDRYAEDAAKVIASGRTPAGTHRPIMVDEILKVLDPRPGEVAVDCTLGYGGHARELLHAIQPGGRLLGMDVDPVELPKTEMRLQSLGLPPESLVVRRTNFAGLSSFIAEQAPGGADMILADLGVSSMQLDDPARGFTFKADAPLDMRMNPKHGQSAAQLLTKLDERMLARLLSDNSDEPRSLRLARAILNAQTRQPLVSTLELASVVRDAILQSPGCSAEDAALAVRRVFQSLRIAVNDEFGALDALLRQLPACLKPGARIAILTFHSGEDRRVKQSFKAGMNAGIYIAAEEFLLRASSEEQRSNPRSASAKLRFATRR